MKTTTRKTATQVRLKNGSVNDNRKNDTRLKNEQLIVRIKSDKQKRLGQKKRMQILQDTRLNTTPDVPRTKSAVLKIWISFRTILRKYVKTRGKPNIQMTKQGGTSDQSIEQINHSRELSKIEKKADTFKPSQNHPEINQISNRYRIFDDDFLQTLKCTKNNNVLQYNRLPRFSQNKMKFGSRTLVIVTTTVNEKNP